MQTHKSLSPETWGFIAGLILSIIGSTYLVFEKGVSPIYFFLLYGIGSVGLLAYKRLKPSVKN